jgi:type II secretory pathway component PulF
MSATRTPARARALAARLAGLFARDSEIVSVMNDAHQRLIAANERPWLDPTVDRLATGEQIRRALYAYQHAAEQRRQLAVDVGELSQQLADTLTAAGHTREQARSANVHQLATGTWQPTYNKETQR